MYVQRATLRSRGVLPHIKQDQIMRTLRHEFAKFNAASGTHPSRYTYMKVYVTRIQHEISFIIAYTLKPICCSLGATFARYGTIKGKTFCRPSCEKDFAAFPSASLQNEPTN